MFQSQSSSKILRTSSWNSQKLGQHPQTGFVTDLLMLKETRASAAEQNVPFIFLMYIQYIFLLLISIVGSSPCCNVFVKSAAPLPLTLNFVLFIVLAIEQLTRFLCAVNQLKILFEKYKFQCLIQSNPLSMFPNVFVLWSFQYKTRFDIKMTRIGQKRH